MTERPFDDFEDLGPVRFPLPEGHPLLDDEDALEAALLQDALASVERNLSPTTNLPDRAPWWKRLGKAVAAGVDQAKERLDIPGFQPILVGKNPAEGSPASSGQQTSLCGIQCQRLVLERFGIEVSEEQLLDETRSSGISWEKGIPLDRVGDILERHGVQVRHVRNANLLDLARELAQGHQVIVGVESGDLWRTQTLGLDIADFMGLTPADHAVIVTSIDTSDPRRIGVLILDPSTGDVVRRYPVGQFLDSWTDSRFSMVCTVEPAPDGEGMENFPYQSGAVSHLGSAPYELVEALHQAMDRSVARRTAKAMLGQFLATVHGHPLTPDDLEVADFLSRHSRLRRWLGGKGGPSCASSG